MAKGPIVSVDGDIIRYTIGCVCDTAKFFVYDDDKELGSYDNRTQLKAALGDDALDKYTVKRRVKAEPLANALHSVKLKLEYIRKATNARDLNIYLTGSGNFRESMKLCLPYKGNRVTRKAMNEMKDAGLYPHYFEQYGEKYSFGKPTHFKAITDYLCDKWDAVIVDDMEVDDELAIQQARAWDWSKGRDNSEQDLKERGHVIASLDKDLMQVPGWFFDFRPEKDRKKGVPDWEFVSEDQADTNLWAQVMSGDMTDNIFGIEGLGLSGAKKRVKEGKAKGLTGEEICTAAYYDWFTKLAREWLNTGGETLKPISRFILDNYEPETYMHEVYRLVRLVRTYDELEEVRDEIGIREQDSSSVG